MSLITQEDAGVGEQGGGGEMEILMRKVSFFLLSFFLSFLVSFLLCVCVCVCVCVGEGEYQQNKAVCFNELKLLSL